MRARGLLAEFFPLGDDLPEVETIRQRTLHVGARFEREALSPAKDPAPGDTSRGDDRSRLMAAMSDRHTAIKVARSRSLSLKPLAMTMVSRSCSAACACRGGQATPAIKRCAASASLGMTPQTPVTVLSDGAVGPRALGEAASIPGPVRHVWDWFHLAMRIQHVAQCVKGWPDTTADERQKGADLADIVEHIRWRLWHGQVRRALDLVVRDVAIAKRTMAEMNSGGQPERLPKVAQALRRALETYVAGLSNLIIDYATARRCEEPFSTSLHRRRGAMAFAPVGWHPSSRCDGRHGVLI